MQGLEFHQGDSSTSDPAETIWLVSGTGDGPPLAQALLKRGWSVLVSVVSEAAIRAYPSHPNLRFQVGQLERDEAVDHLLRSHRPQWVLDATHPFAQVISSRLQRRCRAQHQPLLQLQREAQLPALGTRIHWIGDLKELQDMQLAGERLLLAIGSRHLARALRHSTASQHFARILDNPESLRLALAAGLEPEHLACVRPGALPEGAIERALCRRWQISRVLCRQSGGITQQIWQSLSQELGLPLIQIRSPSANEPTGLSREAMLRQVGAPHPRP
ncbi:precorrin-6A/cobalt-precorrin-6A reductase [Synechococcus sp. A10-1-5-1]|uniref:precorrin-6A/cobalt-precorrin-6A reductase n=1 Tax=Synechococcus sp. A10-1-5-1 TaxID=2936507 RepID=UPI002000A5D5|nr:precorrin-6A/cobalt-precorrin-6A reductase [Synechococcus sp. A10-1-5-1]UPM50319.1 precorrin-6A/cobalt-precorrin-6A reductase [Synechococcus sp. A10-1-5-1]